LKSEAFPSPLRLSPSDIPPGWHAEADNNLAYVPESFPGERFNLPLPFTPLLYSDGHEEILVECGRGSYYIWNEIADDIWRIDEPNNISGILGALDEAETQGKDNGLKTTLLEYPGSKDALDQNQHVIDRWRHGGKSEEGEKGSREQLGVNLSA